MNLTDRYKAYIQEENLFSRNDRLLLAVSGGVDSVVLCALCREAGYDFAVAHCNFQLRGEESLRDRQFVQQLAAAYQLPFYVKDFDTGAYAAQHKLSIQEAARALRYAWFNELIAQQPDDGGQPFRYIVTAHHMDDNIETMVMHFFRGTGIHGLRGMLPRQGKIVRPLLFAHKEELEAYARANNMQWVEDSSNALDKYTRNYFRRQVLPLVREIYPEAGQNLERNLRRFADIEVLYEQALAIHRKKLLEQKGDEVHIPVLKLKKATPLHTIVYEIISDYGFSAQQTGEVIALLDSESGRYIQSATHRIIKNRNWLIIAPLQSKHSQTILIEENDERVEFPNGLLQLKILPAAECKLPAPANMALIDMAALRFPLLLRKWKAGDYFYPLGMRKKKKLARFFIDQKMSLTDKEKVWVLEANKKIVWVVGMRIDDRYKVTDKTKMVLQIGLREA